MKRQHVLTVGPAVAITAAFLLWWLHAAGALPTFRATYHVKAVVPQSAGLGPGASVRVAGLKVGRVTAVKLQGLGALVVIAMDHDYGRIPVDSRFGIRLRTLVGENYVELRPGRAAATVPDGGVLPVTQANDYVEADQVLNLLRGLTKVRERQLTQGVGRAVGGRGEELNRLVGSSTGFIRGASSVVTLLHTDRREVARLVDNVGAVADAVASRGDDLRLVARHGRQTFAAIAARDRALAALIRALPRTMTQVRNTSRVLQRVSGRVSPVLAHLAGAVDELRPAVAHLRPAAQEGRELMATLDETATPLRGTLRRLQRLAPQLDTALPAVRRTLCQVNPMVDYLEPYSRELATVLQDLGSTTNFYDANGHAARLNVSVGPGDIKTFSDSGAAALQDLFSTGLLSKLDLSTHGWNPLPAAGNTDDPTGTGVAGPAQTRAPYPRIKAEC